MLNNSIFIFISITIGIAIAYNATSHYIMTKEEIEKKDWVVSNAIYFSVVIGYFLVWFVGLVVFSHMKLKLSWKDSIDSLLVSIEPRKRLSVLALIIFIITITFISYPSLPILSTQNLANEEDNIENDSGELKRHNHIVYFGCVSIFLTMMMYLVVY